MGPVSAPVSNTATLSGNLSKNLDQIGSRSDTDVKLRARTDTTQPRGVEISRSQTSRSTEKEFVLSESNQNSSSPPPSRAQPRGSLLDVSV